MPSPSSYTSRLNRIAARACSRLVGAGAYGAGKGKKDLHSFVSGSFVTQSNMPMAPTREVVDAGATLMPVNISYRAYDAGCGPRAASAAVIVSFAFNS
jgi:hypothetical protein